MLALTAHDPRSIGRYRIEGRLGAGGMGAVYAGIGPHGQRAAVKVIQPHLRADASFRKRFAREARLLTRVGGACTARVLEADLEADPAYIAIEYVAGETLLDHVVRAGPLPECLVPGLALGLLEALHRIHSAGIVHRDLKPGNIILSADGPKVIDFGIARLTDGTAMTTAGVALGSPGWMAPEQFDGDDVTTAVDVFAWAATVAYASSGRPPFGSGRVEAVYMRTLRGDADLAGLDGPLVPLLQAALVPNPRARPTIDHLLQVLAPASSPRTLTDDATVLLRSTWRLESIPSTWPADNQPTPGHDRQKTARRRVAMALSAATILVVATAATLLARPGLNVDPAAADRPTAGVSVTSSPTSSAGPSAAESQAPSAPTEQAAPASSATPPAPTNTDPYLMTLSGLGPLRIGSSAARIEHVYGQIELEEGSGGGGSCLTGTLTSISDNIHVLIEYGSLSYIQSTDPRVRTPSGIRIGSPRQLIEKTFAAGLVEEESHPYDETVTVLLASLHGEPNQMYLAMQNDQVIEMRVGTPDSVNYAEGCF